MTALLILHPCPAGDFLVSEDVHPVSRFFGTENERAKKNVARNMDIWQGHTCKIGPFGRKVISFQPKQDLLLLVGKKNGLKTGRG
ncbi:MAG: hypothetical protein O2797_07585, partial [Bacteroidetes bacterium]|nr:hypothetical protein [Bacteroidota bacterium]